MGTHARLSPSKAAQWTECPQSVAMQAIYPEDTGNDFTREGTTAHWALEQTLRNGLWSSTEVVGQVCPDTQLAVTDDMVEHVDVAVNYVRQRLEEMGEGTEMHVEVKLNPGQLIGRDDCTGTGDILLVNDEELEAIDYKHGRGVAVEADDPQLILYGIGGIAEFGGPKDRVCTTVIQPRKPHPEGLVRSVEWDRQQMQECVDFFTDAAAATDDPDAPFGPSEDACRWCKAKGACVALADYSLRQAQVIAFPAPVGQVPPEQLREEIRRNTADWYRGQLDMEDLVAILDSVDLVRGWLAAVEGHALTLLQEGREVPGYKLVEGRSQRRWDPDLSEEDLEKKLKNLGLKKTEYMDQKIKSVAQIDGILRKRDLSDVKKRNFSKLIVKPTGKPAIAPASDPRGETSATAVFTVQEQQDVV